MKSSAKEPKWVRKNWQVLSKNTAKVPLNPSEIKGTRMVADASYVERTKHSKKIVP